MDPCQHFGHRLVKLWRNMLIEIDMHQQIHQAGRSVYKQTMFAGPLHDRLRCHPVALGHDHRRLLRRQSC